MVPLNSILTWAAMMPIDYYTLALPPCSSRLAPSIHHHDPLVVIWVHSVSNSRDREAMGVHCCKRAGNTTDGDNSKRCMASADEKLTKHIQLTLTDVQSPEACSTAGLELDRNLRLISAHLGRRSATVLYPKQNIDVANVPAEYLHDVQLYMIESPSAGLSYIFRRLCQQTPPTSSFIMTYSQSACDEPDFRALREEYPPRIIIIAPAWFKHYRPRYGKDTTQARPIGTGADTIVAMYLAPAHFQSLCYHKGKVDVAASVRVWMRYAKRDELFRIVTFAAFTAELETDVLGAKNAIIEEAECAPISYPPCPNNCGYAVTWHETHCCKRCALGYNRHGRYCERVYVCSRMDI